MCNEWPKPREYIFTNAAGKVFYEIAYSGQDVLAFAKKHKATRFRVIDDNLIANQVSPSDLKSSNQPTKIRGLILTVPASSGSWTNAVQQFPFINQDYSYDRTVPTSGKVASTVSLRCNELPILFG